MSWGGGILAYSKSFANFNTHKEFNIIQGKIPNKNNGDIKLAVLVGGSKYKGEGFPPKENYKFKAYECTNGVELTWKPETWKALIETDKPTVCILEFETKQDFNYGDGSLNTILNGYEGKIAMYNTETNEEIAISSGVNANFSDGNFKFNGFSASVNIDVVGATLAEEGPNFHINEGKNILNTSPTLGDGESIIFFSFQDLSYSTLKQMSDFKLTLDGNSYTLKSAVENKKIKPLVLLSGKYHESVGNIFGCYDGGTCESPSWDALSIAFMLEEDVRMTQVSFSSLTASGFNDGYLLYNVKNRVIALKQ